MGKGNLYIKLTNCNTNIIEKVKKLKKKNLEEVQDQIVICAKKEITPKKEMKV